MRNSTINGLRSFRILAIGLALSTGVACSGTAARSGTAGLASDCIINRGVRDFEFLDAQNLIIFGPGNAAYHVFLATPSTFLQGEIAIGIEDADGRICPYGGDAIIVDGPLTERIPIRAIEGLDAAGLEALRVEYGVIEAAGDEVTVTEIETETEIE